MGPGRLRKQQPSHVLSAGIVAVALALTGCSNRIKGEIERQEIKTKSAFFFQQDAVLGTDGLIGIVMTDVPKGCEVWTSYLTATAAAPDAASKATAWAANFPPDFWEVNFLIRVPSTATPIVTPVAGAPWNEGLTLSPQVQGVFTHRLIPHDIGYFDGTGIGPYRKDYVTNSGTMTIEGHEPGASIQGTFPAYTKDAQTGTDTGLVEVHFSAEFCGTADLLDNAGQTLSADGR